MVDYYDENIKIDKKILPKILQNIIQELEHYKESNNWVMYDGVSEGLESCAKQCLLDNIITKKQYTLLLKKYRGYI